MPWLPDTAPVSDLADLPAAPPKPADPTAGELFSAAFRQSNIIASSLSAIPLASARSQKIEPDLDPFEYAKGSPAELMPSFLARARSRAEIDAYNDQIRQEEADRRTVAAGGKLGILADLTANALDPTMLIPAGSFVKAGKVGYSVARSAASLGAATAAGVTVQETALQATQETRPVGQSVLAVGGAAILGSMIGAAGAKLMDNVAYNQLAERLYKEASAAGELPQDAAEHAMKQYIVEASAQPASVGAASVAKDTIGDLAIAGKAAQFAAAPVAGLNPVLRALHSPSAESRRIMLGLMENPIYLKKNLEATVSGADAGGVMRSVTLDPRASDAAVETIMKEAHGAYTIALEETEKLFIEARKAGTRFTTDEFRKRVGRALRRGDLDEAGDASVTAAAKVWRDRVFDPLKDKAIRAGLLPADVSVETARSYFTRMYNRSMIEANEAEFKSILKEWLGRQVDNAKAKDGGELLAAERRSYVDEIANSVFDKITGRAIDGMPISIGGISLATRGPLKERTLSIPDLYKTADGKSFEKYLIDDVEEVARRYTRVMAADVELTSKYGKATLEDQILAIQNDYKVLRSTMAGDAAALERLKRAERSDIGDLKAVRDMLRGQYLAEQQSTNFARAMRVVKAFNAMRAMGGVVLASATDAARPVMVHGLGRYMNDGIGPLVANLKGFRLSAREGKLAGVVGDVINQSRLATLAEITDPYSIASPFERFVDNMSKGFWRLTGMPYWNDFWKSASSVMTQNRIIETVAGFTNASKRDKEYLAFLGIDRGMASRVLKEFETHGETVRGVKVANTEEWTDEIARRAYRAAIAKDVDSIIVAKGVGDIPLALRTPVGSAMTQFRGFALASYQRATLRGLQEDKLAMTAGLIMSVAIGMFIYWLKSVESNRGQDISNNPGRWIAEGIDRSGMLAIPFEVNNTFEKVGGPGIYTGLQALFPNASQKAPASRYSSRNAVDAFLGPTVGALHDVQQLITAGLHGDLTPADINAMRRLTPGATLPFIRSLIEYEVRPALQEAVK